MRLCVSGGAGMIGATLVRRLVAAGHSVSVVDNLWRGKRENLAGIVGFSEDDFHFLDVTDPAADKGLEAALADCDVAIHLADIVAGIGYVFDNQYDIFRQNNLINTRFLTACAHAGISRILYAGTACSFPKNLQRSLDSVLREDQLFPAEPESAYGWSKLIGMLELGYLAKKAGIEATTLMLHNVYGPYCDLDPRRTQVIPSLISRMIGLPPGGTLEVWGSGNQGRAFLFVDDVASAFVEALGRRGLPEVIQIGPGSCTSIRDLVTVLKDRILKKDLRVVYDTSKPEGDIGRSADYSLAQKTLGWAPRVTLDEGLARTYRWIAGARKVSVT